MNKRLKRCPVCDSELEIVEYHCSGCDTRIRGRFGTGDFAALTPVQQEFVKVFICSGGIIREVEKKLGISYPTVKSRLAEISSVLCNVKQETTTHVDDILEEIDRGNLNVEDAIKELNKRS